MKLMLDTNTCIAIIRRRPPRVLERFAAYRVGDIGISWATLAEREFGVAKAQHWEKTCIKGLSVVDWLAGRA